MVLSPLVTAWRLAGWPIRRSPSLVKATIDGVVRAPSAFSMTLGLPPSITATQLLVVPRSIPITLAIGYPTSLSEHCTPRGGLPSKARPVGGSIYAADIGALRLGTRAAQGYKNPAIDKGKEDMTKSIWAALALGTAALVPTACSEAPEQTDAAPD